MCGIAGFIHLDPRRRASRDVLTRMTATLTHRGPDGEGYFVAGPIAFGHRRLAIIDLATGDQPMADPSESSAIVFNGEIYNYRELRRELESLGVHHRTASDTEVLLNAWMTWGRDALRRLNGMFAFAAWDDTTQTFVAARDRAGQKPFYWAVFDHTFLFASEPKALFQYPGLPPVLDRAALQEYLANDYVAAPYTIYRGIFRLPAGHVVEWRPFATGGPRSVDDPAFLPAERYWQVPEPNNEPITASTTAELRSLLSEAIVRHLVADVPVGVFLSGGIDSSAVVGLLRQRGHRVATYSIGFEDPSFDESAHAASVAAEFGTDHHARIFDKAEFFEAVSSLDGLTDEPFGDASLLPTYLLSRFAREEVTVALGGDGSDELWAGYPTQLAHRWLALYRRVPRLLRRGLIEPLVHRLPVSHKNFSFEFKAKRFVTGAAYSFPVNHQVWLGSFHLDEQGDLLVSGAWPLREWKELYRAAFGAVSGEDPPSLHQALLLDFHLYLADDILYKVDRASMATSLEVRAPFLDTELMDFVWRLPADAKLHGRAGKYLLRRALGDVLPAEILNRPKKGFGIPTGYWFRGPLRPALRDTLSILKQTGLFRSATLDRLEREHAAGKFDHRKKLWNLFALGRWWAKWNPRAE